MIRRTMRNAIFPLGLAIAMIALPMSAAIQDRFPDAPGKVELIKVCSECHEAEIVFAHPQTAGEWSETLGSMAQAGAHATDREWQALETYLHAQLAVIRINEASAGEVQATFDVAEPVAQAVVKYRQANGTFKSLDDVKKVPELDAGKVDARKDRLIF